mmetsp:Transcript_10691/g.15450  ORF Transcript_10691/g.15450 Transcript_10691/m.15450 type:complete len:109 (+) Transcript_10691:1046-1372(+)
MDHLLHNTRLYLYSTPHNGHPNNGRPAADSCAADHNYTAHSPNSAHSHHCDSAYNRGCQSCIRAHRSSASAFPVDVGRVRIPLSLMFVGVFLRLILQPSQLSTIAQLC